MLIPPLRRSGVVYNIPCSCGLNCIGETKRALETRRNEHKAAIRWGEVEKSAIAEHAWTEHHRPDWDHTSILGQAESVDTLRIKEVLHIMMEEKQQLLNKDRGIAITDCVGHHFSIQ